MTDRKIIEIEVPCADTTRNTALCNSCLELLQDGYKGRYVLADLYGKENTTLFPITDNTEMVLRCYEIVMSQNDEENSINVVVQGILEQKK